MSWGQVYTFYLTLQITQFWAVNRKIEKMRAQVGNKCPEGSFIDFRCQENNSFAYTLKTTFLTIHFTAGKLADLSPEYSNFTLLNA